MVVAGHYLATEAGLKILEAGGNAVDAGVAAGIALGVLHSCLLYTSPSPRDRQKSRMPSSA